MFLSLKKLFVLKILITMLIVFSIVPQSAQASSQIKVIAFDAFPVFDPRPIFALTKELFPQKGEQIVQIWKSKQFGYTWLRVSGHQYKDFWKVTEDALTYAAKSAKVNLTADKKKKIMEAYLKLQAWPEAESVLTQLKAKGYKLTFLSNFTDEMLRASITSSHLHGIFDTVISTDNAKTFKPDPKAYQLALQQFNVSKEEVLFVPFAAWDNAGAQWFGYRTFWVNRLNLTSEELDTKAGPSGKDLNDLLEYVEDNVSFTSK